LPAVRAIGGAEIVGGVDPDPGRRTSWATSTGAPTFDSLEALLASRPDVVVISTPPASHAEVCIAALDAGAHVVCEKPFVETIEQADAVLDAAGRNGRGVAVNHEFRYMPIFRSVRDAVRRPGIGELVFLHCTQFMDLAPWDEQVPWRAAMPDRSLFEGGVHLVDLFHMLSGRQPRTVFAATSSGRDRTRVADAIHVVTLDYGEGLLGQITIDRLCKSGTRYVDLRVDCEAASLRASYGGRALLQVGVKRAQRPGVRIEFGPEGLAWVEQGQRRRTLGRNPRRATQLATQALYRDAVEAFRLGTEPPTNGRIARETLQIIEASYRSARSGERVEVGGH
jgi:predicted dehydrogenase